MKHLLLSGVLLLGPAACASHPAHCGGRLTPINRPSLQASLIQGPRRAAPRASKAARP